MCHLTGIPEYNLSYGEYLPDVSVVSNSLLVFISDDITFVMQLHRLQYFPASLGLRKRWQYASGMYEVIPYVVGRLTGVTFEDWVRTMITEPLHMDCTNFEVDKQTALGFWSMDKPGGMGKETRSLEHGTSHTRGRAGPGSVGMISNATDLVSVSLLTLINTRMLMARLG